MAELSNMDGLGAWLRRRRELRATDPRLDLLDRTTWVEHRGVTLARERVEAILDDAVRGRCGKHCLLGPSFTGKTMLLERVCRTRGDGVLLVDALTFSDESELLCAIYTTLHGVDRAWMIYHELDAGAARYEVEQGLRERGIKVLVMDGIGIHASRRKDPFGSLFAELERLSSTLGLSILLSVVDDEIDTLVTGYATIRLEPLRYGEEFLNVLRAFERWANLRRPSNLHEEPLARYIYDHTRGRIGLVDRLVSTCARHAIYDREERITIESVKHHFPLPERPFPLRSC
jgi:hypothetical protein